MVIRVTKARVGGSSAPDLEIWKAIPNHSRYEVSSHGRLRSVGYWQFGSRKRYWPPKIMKPCGATLKRHAKACILTDQGTTRTIAVHRLMALSFFGNPPTDKPYALHRDDNRKNNHISNIYWGSPKNNNDDCVRNNHHRSMHGKKHKASTIRKMRHARKKWHEHIGFSKETKNKMSETARRIRG